MQTLDMAGEPAKSEWSSDFAARCPVMLFDAPRGSSTWQKSGAVGELHVANLGGGVLMFQLKDLLDGHVLYRHKMRKGDPYVVKSDRFHTVQQDNGGHKGFAFSEKEAAKEFRAQISEVLPGPPQHYASSEFTSGGSHSSDDSSRAWSGLLQNRPKSASVSNSTSPRKGPVESPSSPAPSSPPPAKLRPAPPPPIPSGSAPSSSSSSSITTNNGRPASSFSTLSLWASAQPCQTTASSSPTSSKADGWGHGTRAKKPRVWERLRTFFACGEPEEERELEIGLPFNVQHVGHVGWDTPSFGLGSWMDDLMKSKEATIASNLGSVPAPAAASSASSISIREESSSEEPQQGPGDEKSVVEEPRAAGATAGANTAGDTEISPAPVPPPEYQDEPTLPPSEAPKNGSTLGAIGGYIQGLVSSQKSSRGKRKKED